MDSKLICSPKNAIGTAEGDFCKLRALVRLSNMKTTYSRIARQRIENLLMILPLLGMFPLTLTAGEGLRQTDFRPPSEESASHCSKHQRPETESPLGAAYA